MTLDDYCKQLGWDTTELSRQARISYNTAKKALDGGSIQPGVARAIAQALREALGQNINVGDIKGLNVSY